jgi:hypothetical protein
MPLVLPQNYSSLTKNETIVALINALAEEKAARKEAIAAGNSERYINSAQKAYYYAGFGCALTVLSTNHLDEQYTDALNFEAKNLITVQIGIRAQCLGVKKPLDASGEPKAEVKIPLLGEIVRNVAALSSWDSDRAKQILATTIINQLNRDIEIESIFKKAITAGKKVDSRQVADLASQVLQDNFLFGFMDGIAFAKGEDELKSIDKKFDIGGVERDVPDALAFLEREFKNLNNAAVIARANSVRPVKGEIVTPVKPQKPVIAEAPVSGQKLEIARYLRVCLG